MKLYKVLNTNRSAYHGGAGTWAPIGEWMPRIDDIKLCERGYHLCRPSDLIHWLGPAIYEVEVDPSSVSIEAGDKVCVSGPVRLVRLVEAWNDRTARLFVCECAERVLPLFEERYPNDRRPRVAIETARRFAVGEATEEEMAAARAAAWAAARDAARAAARAAERSWQTARLLEVLGIAEAKP